MIQPAPSGSGRNWIKSEIIQAHYPLPPTSTSASTSSRLQTLSDNHWHPARPPPIPPKHLNHRPQHPFHSPRLPSPVHHRTSISRCSPFSSPPSSYIHYFPLHRLTSSTCSFLLSELQSSTRLATFLHPQLHLYQHLFSTSSYRSRLVIFHLSSCDTPPPLLYTATPTTRSSSTSAHLPHTITWLAPFKGISRRRTPASSPESQISIGSINPSDPPWPCLVDCPPPF